MKDLKDLVGATIVKNASLEVIENMAADLRLSLMREVLCAAATPLALTQHASDEESVVLYESDELGFGLLAGYFDECWWAGFVLLTSDKDAPTSDLATSVQEHLRKKGIRVALKSEHYAYIELCECEKFSEFLPQVFEKMQANKELLKKLNSALKYFKAS